jgi:hypothetical protein
MCNHFTPSQLKRLSNTELSALFNKLCKHCKAAASSEHQSRKHHAAMQDVRRELTRRAILRPPGS